MARSKLSPLIDALDESIYNEMSRSEDGQLLISAVEQCIKQNNATPEDIRRSILTQYGGLQRHMAISLEAVARHILSFR